ncbi:hypothetical protein WJX73_004665 [Symbiochloris irregularis]|uniref:Uncharacterized protein n=1 Tax=Symbiochloris irregularis TaxID=706552 RepID=A0AAW1PIL2_9CHLO
MERPAPRCSTRQIKTKHCTSPSSLATAAPQRLSRVSIIVQAGNWQVLFFAVIRSKGFRVYASVRKEADAARLQKHFGTERFTPLLFDITDEDAAFLPLLGTDKSLTGPPGRLIQLSSVLGEAEMPYQAVYCASKHGLEAVTACLRRELDPYHIKVVTIRPGSTTSDFWGKTDWTTHDGGPWEKGMKTAHALVDLTLKRPTSCKAVAQTALRAVTASRPRIVYYTVGSWDQWLGIKMIGSWLPLWLVDLFWLVGLRNL